MKKGLTVVISVLFFFCFFSNAAPKEKTQKNQKAEIKETVEVSAEKGIDSTVEYIDEKKINFLSLNSNYDVLSVFPSLFLITRGLNGVQSDISYRASAGNQVGVKIDGVPINNMQTYHHNFDIPLAPEDIETVSVSSAVKGDESPYSFAGSVNFKPGKNINEFNHLAYGSDNYYHIYARENGFSYMFEGSEGYVENSKYNKSNLTYQFTYNGAKVFTAFNSKHFDAKDFYSPYPSYEETQTNLIIASFGNFKLYGVRHLDLFTLDKNNPEFFFNSSETYKTGITQNFTTSAGFFSYTVEYNSIDSLVIGKRDLTVIDVKYSRLFFPLGLSARAGFNFHSVTNTGDNLLPFLTLAKKIRGVEYSFEFSRSLRIPDFTELYYVSPVNVGNPDLKAEKAANYELSAVKGNAKAVFFYRREKNLIDWVREGEKWYAGNIGSASVKGFELSYKKGNFTLSYAYTKRNELNAETKYTYYYAKNKLNLIYTGKDFALNYRYLDINGLGKASVLDLTFWGEGFYLKVLNAFDEDYQTYPGIPMPGRVVIFGYRMKGPLIPD